MKLISLLTTLLISTFVFSQVENDTLSVTGNNLFSKNNSEKIDTFTFDINGLTPKVLIIDIEGLSKNDLLTKAIAWAKEKYGNFEEAVQIKDKNKKIAIRGFADNALCFGVKPDYKCEGLSYNLVLTIQNGKYRFKPTRLSYNTSANKRTWVNLNKSAFHESSTTLKKGHDNVPSQIEALFNNLNKSLQNYLNDKMQEDEW
ncbi:DUF4468 domain-containing protein [Tamlana sp. 2201CG12-4]|uniref:DUF4468 domain-containing protein n=1 Tax=Tamlana sp. 2201CG12-4 TaxID=3112582 RepID=UPI002DB81926|nr:DUF4468 domain-containing protein [Tamlana sp. 2201CG12-4]MEC3905710.1 DUF4468 domain-containing protein [Tamlana sp. 2201CG12-4]